MFADQVWASGSLLQEVVWAVVTLERNGLDLGGKGGPLVGKC